MKWSVQVEMMYNDNHECGLRNVNNVICLNDSTYKYLQLQMLQQSEINRAAEYKTEESK